MRRSVFLALAALALALPATAGSAQVYPLTNGPDGRAPNTIDSAAGFIGGNAVATERELLYYPQRAGNAAARLGITADPARGAAAAPAPEDAAPVPRRAERHRRPHQPRRHAPRR